MTHSKSQNKAKGQCPPPAVSCSLKPLAHPYHMEITQQAPDSGLPGQLIMEFVAEEKNKNSEK